MKRPTIKVQGETFYNDLEGGYYTLKTTDGKIYKLAGGGRDLYQRGLQLELEGYVDDSPFGIGFGTPVLQVSSYQIKSSGHR